MKQQTDHQHNSQIESQDFKLPVPPYRVERVVLGEITELNLRSTLSPFRVAENHIQSDPMIISQVSEQLQRHINLNSRLVIRNKEGDGQAYAHAMVPGSVYSEPFFQVDMVASPNQTDGYDVTQKIFEFESSIAMYELIQTVGGKGRLRVVFRDHLDVIRERSGKPIFIIAPTEEKFESILGSEFGVLKDANISEPELNRIVKEHSGFDGVFGPEQLLNHLRIHEGDSTCLFYVRPSDPISKLRKPNSNIQIRSILDNPQIRRAIRRNSITLNIDNPAWSVSDPRILRDSKMTLPTIGMGYVIRGARDFERISRQEILLYRAKPRAGVYGAYGQLIAQDISNPNHVNSILSEVKKRGSYILQPEMAPLVVISESGKPYVAMDRLFFSNVLGNPTFMGGIRILIPIESQEAKKGRLHGSREMISVPIV